MKERATVMLLIEVGLGLVVLNGLFLNQMAQGVRECCPPSAMTSFTSVVTPGFGQGLGKPQDIAGRGNGFY